MNNLKLEIRKRITFLFVMVVIVMVSLIARLAWIQIIQNTKYQHQALDQRLRQLQVEPKRGIIYDKNGVELAVSASADTVVAIPNEINNPRQTAQQLADILEMPEDEIYSKLTKTAAAVYVVRKTDEKKARKIRELNLAGIRFTEESKRFYPKGNLAAHTLGFVGIDSQGLQGIELSYDDILRGNPGRISVERDAAGREIPEGIKDYVDPDDGHDIYLTIDNVLQHIAERELDKAMLEHEAKSGTIVMMDPQTGGVMALANRPTFDPNDFVNSSPELWRNRAVSDTYEPGSTFKIITTAAGLEEGVVNPNDTFFDPGHIEVSGQIINCWKAGGHGSQTFAEVVQNSCNPGFVQVGQRIGTDVFYDYIEAFDFGRKTDIDLVGEAQGIKYGLDQIGPVELATMSFGHGITVTPIQLTTAVSAIANDGELLRPHLVSEIKGSRGELIKEITPEKNKRVISSETAQKTRELLAGVVEEGSGTKAAVEGYEIAGKTGTAKHYGVQLYDSSFIGMVPADDPQMVVLVVLSGVSSYPYYGSQVAAPIFHNVVKDGLRHLEIPPTTSSKDEEEEIEKVEVPNVENLYLSEAQRELAARDLNVKLEGEGELVVDQLPHPEAVVNEGSTVVLFFEDGTSQESGYQVTVPDLRGMRIREAAELLGELNLRVRWDGSGIIERQDPAPGITVQSGEYIEVQLSEE
ncbi:stage V sporulation protein D [Natroniella sulfidigena]|uniref:stage V sporulation protein D n=1 Tax=Natroniella sulfidigena TaxID=723921 RepID=UPI00200B4D35|nr:stage V sporulation protein D [Natroniella sulfidigena]